MNISQQNIDDLTATITLTIDKEDYATKVDNVLKEQRKNAQIPGFRKGKVPMGLIKKQYGMSVQMDEINKLVSQNLQQYLNEADFKVLGEPLPSEKQETIDFDNAESFEFLFDIGITPTVDVELSEKDSVVLYNIEVEAEAVNKQVNQFASQFAEMSNPETAEESDMLKGDAAQVDADGNIVEGGMAKDAAILSPVRIDNADLKKQLIGAKVGTTIVFNALKSLGSETEVATFIGGEAEDVVDADVKFTVTEITRYTDAELNEDLFKKAYPTEEIATEEDFRKRIEEDVKKNSASESDARFEWDARDYIVAKLKDVAFPEVFLKRWIIFSNKENEEFDAEKLNADFPKVLDDLRWQLATSVIAEKAELKIEADDPMNTAKQMAAQQFAMYGMANLPEEYYEDYAKKLLEDQTQMESIMQKTMNDKLVAHIKANVSLESKTISMEDFKKLYEQE
jgi:trigger factor